MRLIGMSLVLISTSGFGVIVNMIQNKRIKDLSNLKTFLIYLKSEINYALTPITDAIDIICMKEENDIVDFFSTYNHYLKQKNEGLFNEIDEVLIQSILYNTCLNSKDVYDIYSFLNKLGSIDKESQLNQINMMTENLTEKINQLKESTSKNQKLYKTMGVMFGVLVIILFL